MNVRFLSIALGLAALLWGGELRAQNVPGKDLNADEIRKNAVEAHQELARQFADFQKQIQLLKGRLDRSPNIEDRDRAQALQKVLDRAEASFIRVKFARLQELLRKPAFTLDDYKEAALQNALLAKDLGDLVELFDGQGRGLSDEIRWLQDMLKILNNIYAEQQRVEALTRGGKTDPKEAQGLQKDLAKDTKDLGNKLGKNPNAKPGDGKPGGEGGLGKPSVSTPKDGKSGDGKSGAGEAKDGGKPGDAKPGDGKGGDGKGGDGKGGDGKGGDGKGGDGKGGDGKGGDGKGGDGKGGDGKGGDGKGDADAKPGDKGPEDTAKKPDDGKKGPDAASKPAAADTKGGGGGLDPSGGKSDGQGSQNKSDPAENPNDKSPSFGIAPPSIPGKPFPALPQPPPPGAPMRPTDDGPVFKLVDPGDMGPAPDAVPIDELPDPRHIEPLAGKKQVLEAYDRMKDAIPKIPENIKGANADQNESLEHLRKAKAEIEQRLKMLRLEEAEQILAALRHRCEKAKQMQIDVLNNPNDGTIATERAILGNSDQKPTDSNFQAALRLGFKEKEIISEIDKCLEILRTDATGVAFPVAFEQVRDDMRNVYRRFDLADVGKMNQGIQQDIIDSLDDMIKALKQKEIDLIPMPPMPPMPTDPKDPKEPPEPSLLKRIQELKMIRAMQDRLNKRTEKYAKLFPGQEQPTDPNIRREVTELRARQEQIFDITNKIQKEVNK